MNNLIFSWKFQTDNPFRLRVERSPYVAFRLTGCGCNLRICDLAYLLSALKKYNKGITPVNCGYTSKPAKWKHEHQVYEEQLPLHITLRAISMSSEIKLEAKSTFLLTKALSGNY